MHLHPYRRVLALPGVRPLMVLAPLARIPITAIGVTMTLHVAQDLHRGWGAAGLVGAALTVGTAIGGPLNGRFVDRRGLRPMLVVTTVAEALFWVVAPFLAFPVLLAGAFVAGLFSLPVFSVIRQSIAALVPTEQRRQAYALDSMSVELSFMAGPPLAVLLTSTLSGRAAMWSIGGALVLAGLALYVANPPVHTSAESDDPAPTAPTRRGDWLTPRFVAVLAAASATTMVLAGTDLGIVAMLRAAGEVGLVGTLLAAWAVYSLVGGFIYGALPRAVPLAALLAALAVCTIPAGLVGHAWPLLFLTLLPAGALCAPTLTASADLVSRLVPPSARGEAMGWHGSSLTVGLAIGSPLAGWAIDQGGPAWGFAAVGAVGAAAATALLLVHHNNTTTPPKPATPTPATPTPATPTPATLTTPATPTPTTPATPTPATPTPATSASMHVPVTPLAASHTAAAHTPTSAAHTPTSATHTPTAPPAPPLDPAPTVAAALTDDFGTASQR